MSKRFHIPRCISMTLSALVILFALSLVIFSLDALLKLPYATQLIGTNLLTYGAATILIVGLLALILTPIGLYALVVQHSSLLALFTLGIFGTACLSMMGGILGFCLRQELAGGSLYAWMRDGIRSGYGHSENIDVTNAWDRMQQDLQCCGVDGADEWKSSDWFLGQIRFPRRHRPSSCCVSCNTAVEKFCTGQVIDSEGQTAEAAICERAKSLCPKLDDTVFDIDVCTAQRPIPTGTLAEGFMFTEGCFPLLESRLSFYASQITLCGFLGALMLYLNAGASFVLIYATDPLLTYDAVNTHPR